MKADNNDTIAAISTSLGEGGIGIVRLSGTSAIKIAEKVFSSPNKKKLSSSRSHTVHYGHIKVPETKEILDEVLVTVMRAPKTYTLEDVVEVSCHGGTVSLKKVLAQFLTEGARLAEPGEFTKRAFLNGRMDLSQAEAVLDIITSKTDASQKAALQQLKGEFSCEVQRIRSLLIDALSYVELRIDFSEEDVALPKLEEIRTKIESAFFGVKSMLKTADKGMLLREGASVVICGRPNVGKSSLMNALLKHDRVIVTPVAGTTRDVIEESINLNGIRVKVSDTAGIIETADRVEIEGIKRSKEKLASSDIVIFMLDASCELSRKDEEIYEAIKEKKCVIVINKIDLKRVLDEKDLKEKFASKRIIKVSALKKEGLEALEDALTEELLKGEMDAPESLLVTNMRHKELLEKAAKSLESAVKSSNENYKGELLASDLHEAVRFLGLIIGEEIEDDILERIFSQFCIGK